MRSNLVYASCPGFGIRLCLHCKLPWISSASEICVLTNQYCPVCIPIVMRPVRPEDFRPQTHMHEQRIQRRLAELRRAKAISVQQQRKEIGKARRPA